MKQFVLIVAATLTLATCGKQPTQKTAKEMNALSFTTEQAAFMSAIACNEAKADYTALAQAIDKGLDAGLTYHTDVKPNASNEWLEAVDDEWYGKLR